MSLIMFEGFNRPNDFDPNLWTVSNTTISAAGNYATWGSGTVRDSVGLYLYPPNPTPTSSWFPAFATATFPGAAQPADGAEIVCVGFCASYESLTTDVVGADIKYFGIVNSAGDEICTIELKGADSSEFFEQDLTKLTLQFKQNNSTTAEFNIPDTAVSIYTTPDGLRKQGSTAYLNLGTYYFEFEFNFADNTVAVFFNGMQLLTPAGATTAALTLSSMKRWIFYAVKYAVAGYDDFYVLNNNGGDGGFGGGQRLGYQTRVVSPTAQSFIPRQILGGGGDEFPSAWENHTQAGRVNSRDGDQSTIYTATPDAVAHYTFPATMGDQVVAVRLGVVARGEGHNANIASNSSISLQYKYGQYMPTADPPSEGAVDLGTFQITAAYYNTFYTEFMPTKPVGAGLGWVPSDFSDNEDELLGRIGFGVKYLLD